VATPKNAGKRAPFSKKDHSLSSVECGKESFQFTRNLEEAEPFEWQRYKHY
jgi:hypothetical protein